MNKILALLVFEIVLSSAHAQTSDSDLNKLPALGDSIDLPNLEDLLNINVQTTVVSKKAQSTRETPGIVTIITEDEIRNMGAKDLMEVLSLIPSVNFGNDVQGVIGLGIRGLWAHEGKHLLLIDGIEMNEIQYGTTQLGNHYPVDQIKRIEIIRGPGSVIYGGFAELAVINIITKSGKEIGGANAQYTYGRMAKGSELATLGLSLGTEFDGLDVSVGEYSGHTHRGEGLYAGASQGSGGGTFDYKIADELRDNYVNVGAKTENLHMRFIYDEYRVTTRSMFGFTGLDANIENLFKSYNFATDYKLNITRKLSITPYLHVYMQAPWVQVSEAALEAYKIFDIRSQRIKAGATAAYAFNPRLNFLAGFEYIDDRHHIHVQRDKTIGDYKFLSGGDNFNLNSKAGFAQVQMDTRIGSFIAGARYEQPSRSESSFVPRLGYTKSKKYWHVKALYSNAFRSPVMSNIDIEPKIRPEKTQTYELEGGFSTSKTSYLTANVYYTKIRDPIVYFFTTTDEYANFGDVATKGLELDWRWKEKWGQMSAGYAFYELDTNKVDRYQISNTDDAMLGMPQHQAVLNSFIYLGSKDLKLGPTLIYQSSKYAFESDPSADTMVESKLPATVIGNIYLAKENLLLKGFSGGVGVSNIFNNSIRYVQPYDGGHGTAPGPSHEPFVRAEYSLNF
jgi:outer membrane cobalamin receptor